MNTIQSKILETLKNLYLDIETELLHDNEVQLSVAVILSAQTTDKQVNSITPDLFARCKTAEDFADIKIEDLEKLIYKTGFYRNKAKNIKAFAKKLLTDFNGVLPKTLDELVSLPGVGRKTANVIQQEVYGVAEGIVVDTHCLRLSYRMGFSSSIKNPEKMEKELMKVLPKKYWRAYSHWCIHHGRKYCIARNPKCKNCPIEDLCPKNSIIKPKLA